MASPETAGEPRKGFDALLHQNEIADAEKKAEQKIESIEERIKKQAPPRVAGAVRNIRTYRSDVEEGITRGDTTLVSMAAARGQNAPQAPGGGLSVILSNENVARAKKISTLVLGAALLLGGIGTVSYVLWQSTQNTVSPQNRPESLIFVEQVTPIDGTRTSKALREAVIAERTTRDDKLGSMTQLWFTKQVPVDEKIQTEELTTEEFFKALALGAPARFVRALAPQFLFGIHTFDGNQPFMIFKVTSYESAFAGLLEWERTIGKDLGSLMRNESDFLITTATTSPLFVARTFEDNVYRNTDIRAFKSTAGKILLLYSFPARDTVIITTNVQTLGEIMNRLATRRVVR